MRDLDAGILGSSRDTASAPRGSTEIELSQSTASVEPDREPSRSARVRGAPFHRQQAQPSSRLSSGRRLEWRPATARRRLSGAFRPPAG